MPRIHYPPTSHRPGTAERGNSRKRAPPTPYWPGLEVEDTPRQETPSSSSSSSRKMKKAAQFDALDFPSQNDQQANAAELPLPIEGSKDVQTTTTTTKTPQPRKTTNITPGLSTTSFRRRRRKHSSTLRAALPKEDAVQPPRQLNGQQLHSGNKRRLEPSFDHVDGTTSAPTSEAGAMNTTVTPLETKTRRLLGAISRPSMVKSGEDFSTQQQQELKPSQPESPLHSGPITPTAPDETQLVEFITRRWPMLESLLSKVHIELSSSSPQPVTMSPDPSPDYSVHPSTNSRDGAVQWCGRLDAAIGRLENFCSQREAQRKDNIVSLAELHATSLTATRELGQKRIPSAIPLQAKSNQKPDDNDFVSIVKQNEQLKEQVKNLEEKNWKLNEQVEAKKKAYQTIAETAALKDNLGSKVTELVNQIPKEDIKMKLLKGINANTGSSEEQVVRRIDALIVCFRVLQQERLKFEEEMLTRIRDQNRIEGNFKRTVKAFCAEKEKLQREGRKQQAMREWNVLEAFSAPTSSTEIKDISHESSRIAPKQDCDSAASPGEVKRGHPDRKRARRSPPESSSTQLRLTYDSLASIGSAEQPIQIDSPLRKLASPQIHHPW